MKFIFQSTGEGMEFGDYSKARFKQDLKDNKGARYSITHLTPESKKMRGFLHGAVYPLWLFLDGKDCRDQDNLTKIHEVAKLEFNWALFQIGDKSYKVPKSTRGEALMEFIERVIVNLEEQYGINRTELLDPEKYKVWRDTVFSTGPDENYISYLESLGVLKKPDPIPPWRKEIVYQHDARLKE